jgi:general stress protein 26
MGFVPRSNVCRNKDGEIIREEGKILRRWENILKNYYRKGDEDEE